MKIIMTSVYDDGKKLVLAPGDAVDMDDAEAQRIISVGGARLPNEDELAAAAADDAAKAAAADAAKAKK